MRTCKWQRLPEEVIGHHPEDTQGVMLGWMQALDRDGWVPVFMPLQATVWLFYMENELRPSLEELGYELEKTAKERDALLELLRRTENYLLGWKKDQEEKHHQLCVDTRAALKKAEEL